VGTLAACRRRVELSSCADLEPKHGPAGSVVNPPRPASLDKTAFAKIPAAHYSFTYHSNHSGEFRLPAASFAAMRLSAHRAFVALPSMVNLHLFAALGAFLAVLGPVMRFISGGAADLAFAANPAVGISQRFGHVANLAPATLPLMYSTTVGNAAYFASTPFPLVRLISCLATIRALAALPGMLIVVPAILDFAAYPALATAPVMPSFA
jgi:hypothetical protein